MLLRITCLALLLASTAPVSAAPSRCVLTDTVIECWNRYLPDRFAAENTAEARQRREDAAKKEANAEANALLDLVTSAATGGSDVATTVDNFLPLLSLTGFAGNLDGGDSSTASDEDISFKLNLPFFGSGGSNALQLQASFKREPILYQPLIDAVPEDEREAFVQTNDDLDIGDDARFEVSYNMVNDRFGRSFRQHRARFESMYFGVVNSVALPMANFAQALQDFATQLKTIDSSLTPPGTRTQFSSWVLTTKDANGNDVDLFTNEEMKVFQLQALAVFEQTASAVATYREAEASALARTRLLEFHKLVDNQPQLNASFFVQERDELAGPDEIGLNVSLEWPLGGNLNGFLRKNTDSCGAARARDVDPFGTSGQKLGSAACTGAFSTYVGNLSAIAKNAPRLSLAIEYSDIDDYNATFEDPAFTVNRQGSEKLTASLAFGMRMPEDSLARDSRFDLSVKYEDISDDPDRNDRTIATFTWTRKFSDITIPISLVYSNKAEFDNQEELDERLSAHFGLRYDFKQRE